MNNESNGIPIYQQNQPFPKAHIWALVLVGISMLLALIGYSDISKVYGLFDRLGRFAGASKNERLEGLAPLLLAGTGCFVSGVCSLIWAIRFYTRRAPKKWLLILSIITVLIAAVIISAITIRLNSYAPDWVWEDESPINDFWICAALLIISLFLSCKSDQSADVPSAKQMPQQNPNNQTCASVSQTSAPAMQTVENVAEGVTQKTSAFASKLASKLKKIADPLTLNVPEPESTKPNLVGEVTPFKGPEGNVRGYMFDSIVYATREQAEAARSEKEARVFEGVLYATKQEADAAREAKADLEARTFEGVVYETRELAEKARAEKEEIEYCTVDGIRYATREQADQARAEKAEIEYCTVDGVRYATREMADQIRAENADREARTVNGFVYATHEQADEAREKDRRARIYNGVEYPTLAEAQAARNADLAERTVDGVLYATKEEADTQREQGNYYREKLAYLFDEERNNQYSIIPQYSFGAIAQREQLSNLLAKWLDDADENRLLEWKRRIETIRVQKTIPMPLADLALKEIEKRLSGDAPAAEPRATENAAATEKTADEDKSVPTLCVSAEPQTDGEKKNGKTLGIIAAVALVVGVILMLPKSGNKPTTQNNTPQAARQQSAQYNRRININGMKVNVRSVPSMKNSSVLFQLNDESVRTSEKRYTGDKYPWFKIEKNGRQGWVYGRYVSE